MIWLFKAKFNLWDLFGILFGFNVLNNDLTMLPVVALLGFVWLFIGRCMERTLP